MTCALEPLNTAWASLLGAFGAILLGVVGAKLARLSELREQRADLAESTIALTREMFRSNLTQAKAVIDGLHIFDRSFGGKQATNSLFASITKDVAMMITSHWLIYRATAPSRPAENVDNWPILFADVCSDDSETRDLPQAESARLHLRALLDPVHLLKLREFDAAVQMVYRRGSAAADDLKQTRRLGYGTFISFLVLVVSLILESIGHFTIAFGFTLVSIGLLTGLLGVWHWRKESWAWPTGFVSAIVSAVAAVILVEAGAFSDCKGASKMDSDIAAEVRASSSAWLDRLSKRCRATRIADSIALHDSIAKRKLSGKRRAKQSIVKIGPVQCVFDSLPHQNDSVSKRKSP
jgi:hypothetical protein